MMAGVMMNVVRHLRFLALGALALPSFAVAQLATTPSTTEGPYYPFNASQRLDTAWLVDADKRLGAVP